MMLCQKRNKKELITYGKFAAVIEDPDCNVIGLLRRKRELLKRNE